MKSSNKSETAFKYVQVKKLEPIINHFERQKITHFGQWLVRRATRGLARVLTIFEVGIALAEMLMLVSIAFQNWTILTLKTCFK
jgi:hypothetical protein